MRGGGQRLRGLVPICAAWLTLAGCDTDQRSPQVDAAPSAVAPAPKSVPKPAPKPLAEPAAPPRPAQERPAFTVPARFTALGTEPFWAAKVDGPRLTYSTPEDQAGQAIAVTRTPRPDRIDVVGLLGGQRMTLTVSAGPCSDGMSDTVYPFAVRRRLGDDEQRGCAKPG